MMKVIKSLECMEGNMRKTGSYIDKIRGSQDKYHQTNSASKHAIREFVTADAFRRVKERINHAFAVFLKMHEEGYNRDHVLTESLLETHNGKMGRRIVSKTCNETVARFAETEFDEAFEFPDIMINMVADEPPRSRSLSSHKRRRRVRSQSKSLRKRSSPRAGYKTEDED